MLTPADIVAAKLAVQLGEVPVDVAREALIAADAEPDPGPGGGPDVLGRLTEAGYLAPQAAARARRYLGFFEHVRYEALYLRRLERLRTLPKDEVGEWIARIERDSYRRRLGQVLVGLEKLSEEEARAIDDETRRLLRREDLKVLERYRADRFEGVARPLIPKAVVDTAVFKVSVLFRSRETRVRVDRAALRLQEAELERTMIQDFVPSDPGMPLEASGPDAESEGLSEADEKASKRYETARLREAIGAEDDEDEGDGDDEGSEGSDGDLDRRERIARYHVVEQIGRGGMGAVYLAQEEGFGPMVAVKVTLPDRAKAEDVARFEREAALCARVRHENVVHLIDEGRTDDGLRFMAIPFYTGKPLKALMPERTPLEPAFVFHVLEQVLAGLEAMHQQKIVHRDIKAENVFILAGADRRVRVVDLGIARLMDDDLPAEQRLFRSRDGVISGSPAYVAPETITGDPIDGRTDIYSLGIMAFEMFTGRLPLWAETPYDYLREHLVGIPLSLSQAKKDTSWAPALETLIARMLAKERAHRPPSCQAILDELQGGLRDEALERIAAPPAADEQSSSGLFNSFFRMLGR